MGRDTRIEKKLVKITEGNLRDFCIYKLLLSICKDVFL